jgi:hypothetical protein
MKLVVIRSLLRDLNSQRADFALITGRRIDDSGVPAITSFPGKGASSRLNGIRMWTISL